MAALKAAKAAGAQAAPETAPAETVKAPEPSKETLSENKAPEKAQALTPEDRIRIAKEKMAAIKAARAAGASRKDVPENQDRL